MRRWTEKLFLNAKLNWCWNEGTRESNAQTEFMLNRRKISEDWYEIFSELMNKLIGLNWNDAELMDVFFTYDLNLRWPEFGKKLRQRPVRSQTKCLVICYLSLYKSQTTLIVGYCKVTLCGSVFTIKFAFIKKKIIFDKIPNNQS